ncbi:uncharacterized protein BXZ73DRAFT_112040 [Epithele typhae]|uniref:uncharacterized protein n=1 Tax=Epithele typhae TaxID=378194 RepID=UPI0020086899|nr:uncharacterized protein BXZ73DRAFT_112040 [Epithele typhae]KAH9889254.1 hypothetical protein BXZ73DRAFT_112040 [Epithele typhae]
MQTLVSDRGLRRADPPSQDVLTGEFKFMQAYRPIRELVEHSAPRIRECDGIAAIQPFVAHAFSSSKRSSTRLTDGIRHLVTPSLVAALENTFIHLVGTEDWRHMDPPSLYVGMCKDRLLDLTWKVPPCRAPPPDASSSAAGPQLEKQSDQAAEPELPCGFPVEADATATPHEMSVAPDAVPATLPTVPTDMPRAP